MSKNEFDALLLKKIEEDSFTYNPASWDKLSQLLPPTIAQTEFDNAIAQRVEKEEFAYKPASWDTLAQLLPVSLAATNEFDQSIVSKIEETELAYQPAHWDKVAALLPPTTAVPFIQKGNKWRVPVGIAAALLLLLGGTLFFKLFNNNGVEDKDAPPQLSKVEAPKTQQQPQSITEPIEDKAAAEKIKKSTGSNNNMANNHTANSQPNNSQQNNIIAPVMEQEDRLDITKITPQNEDSPIIAPIVESPKRAQDLREEASFVIAKNKEQNNNDYGFSNKTDPYYASAFYEGKPNAKKNPKTSVAVAGGVNYGNVNTGYSAGVSLRRKIAGDFFVDGTVAMMYNNNANDLINYSGPVPAPQGNRAARPAAANVMAVSAPAIEPTQNLYYVQFNPSFGYQIEKHVALSVGGDFQQMMKTEDGKEKMQLVANSAKLFPTFDVGITAKSEFGITPNIHAGLIYREGLNNLLKSDGNQYVNRRYVQVQFKYSLPVN